MRHIQHISEEMSLDSTLNALNKWTAFENSIMKYKFMVISERIEGIIIQEEKTEGFNSQLGS